jgi:DnaB helicase-like protein/AAA domain-containing protein
MNNGASGPNGQVTSPENNGNGRVSISDDRLPLHSPEHERAVLGGLLIDPGQMSEVLKIVSADDFYSSPHEMIFRVMQDLHRDGKSWDVDIIATELGLRRQFDVIGGDNYLAKIVSQLPHAEQTREHAGYVKFDSDLRRYQQAGDELSRDALSRRFTPAQVLDRHKARIEDAPAVSVPFDLQMISSRELCEPVDPPKWFINQVMLPDQPMVIGGPMKSLKTSIMADMSVSLGTATWFLGRFPVKRLVRVAVISGESGRLIIRGQAKQVAEDRGVYLEDADILWGFKLPDLTSDAHLKVLEKMIRDTGREVLMIDPLYLTMLGDKVDQANMFAMGPFLDRFGKMCLEAKCLPVISHHFKKHRDDWYAPPELHELAYGGISQWMAQWCLVSRREPYDATTGIHKLHWRHGGRFGHAGELAIDIDTGVMNEDFSGRKWDVHCESVSGRIVAEHQAAESRRIERDAQASAEKERKTREDMAKAIEVFKNQPDRRLTERNLRDALGWRSDRTPHVLYRLERDGFIRPCEFTVRVGKDPARTVQGFELIEDK